MSILSLAKLCCAFFILALASLVLGAPLQPVFAQTATQDITISATVNGYCSINNAATGGPSSATIPISTAGAVVLGPITPTNSPFANVACNTPSVLQLQSLNGGATNGATATDFQSFINYTAEAVWHGVTAALDTTSSSGTGPVTGTPQNVATAFSGSMSVTINPISNALPLVQGSYSDTLRITLTPQ
ncbi:hypothetical protein [Hyphomicrobium sulfonivorans]|uniref:hypothetical protein n=1 Tax=Hyphomicrobium sulfonivorans TaxID=121290 RepID=UPI0009FB86FB|nr:hypothetical protein [Hyphomicrobium sulfonivorans]